MKKRLSIMLATLMGVMCCGQVFAQKVGNIVTLEGEKYLVTGENRISNPSFEDGLTDWIGGDGTALSVGNFTVNTEGGVDNGAYIVGTANGGIGSAGSIGTGWALEQAKPYLFSYSVKSQDDSRTASTQPYLKVSLTEIAEGSSLPGEESEVLINESSIGAEGAWTKNAVVFSTDYSHIQARFRWLSGQYGFDEFFLGEVTNLAEISETKPVDLSALIVNPGFDGNSKEGWNGISDAAVNSNILEFYQKVFDLNQTITGLPAGYYQIKAQGYSRSGSNDGGEAYLNGTEEISAKLYAQAGSSAVSTALMSLYAEQNTGSNNNFADNMAEAATAFEDGKYANNITEKIFVEEGGSLTIGMKYDAAAAEGSWTIFDNFQLIYNGNQTDLFIAELETAITRAEEILSASTISSALVASLTDQIFVARALIASGSATAEELAEAQVEMLATIALAEASAKAYDALKDALDVANANKADYINFVGYATFETAIATAQALYDAAATATDAVNDVVATLEKAEKVCRFTESAPADFTFAILNPDANDGNNNWMIVGPINNTRSTESYLGANADPYFDGGNWNGSAWTTTMSQTISDLPAGSYMLKTVSRASDGATMTLNAVVNGIATSVVCPSLNATGGSIWENAEDASPEKGANSGQGWGWSENSVAFKVLQGESLTITFSATTASAHQWFSVDRFELLFEAAEGNVAPSAPSDEYSFTSVKPVTTGQYVIYHPDSKKFLSNNAAGDTPVLNHPGYVADADAYLWDVSVGDAYSTMQQLSSTQFVNASTNNTWGMHLNTETDNVSSWIFNDADGGYTISSTRSPAKFIGVDNLTGDNIGIYYDKTSAHSPLFQFISTEEFAPIRAEFAKYAEELSLYNVRQELLTTINYIGDKVTANPADYSAEATAAYSAVMAAAREAYLNEEITVDELQAAGAALITAGNAYMMSVITASDDQPADVSFVIQHPGFDNNTTSGWNGTTGAVNLNAYEFYQVIFDMNQTISGLPSGYYQLKVDGFAREKANDKGAAYTDGTEDIQSKLYIGSGGIEVNTKLVSLYSEANTGAAESMGFFANSMAEGVAAFADGKYGNNLTESVFVGEDGILTIGVKYDAADVVNGSWNMVDNFQLIYKGNTLGTLISEVLAAVERADALEGHMQTSVATTLANEAAAAKDVAEGVDPTKEDLEEAKANIEAAIAAAEASIAAYTKLATAVAAAENSSVATEADVIAAITTASGVYNAKEVGAEGIDAAIAALGLAVNTKIVELAEEGDVTELIVNPTILQTADIKSKPAGWENSMNEGTNGNFTKVAGTADVPVDTYLEAWNSNASTIVFDYNQIIANVPNGVYVLGAATFTEATNGNAVLYANDETVPLKTGLDGGTFDQTEINQEVIVIVTDNTLRIGIKTIGTVDKAWSGADFFTLTYAGEDADALLAAGKEELAVLKAEALALKNNEQTALLIVKAEMNKLEAAIASANEALESNSLNIVNAAIVEMEAALEAAETSIELCSALAVIYEEGLDRLDPAKYEFTQADGDAFKAVLDENFEIYINQTDDTDNDAIRAAKAAIEAAYDIFKEQSTGIGINSAEADSVKVYSQNGAIVVEGTEDYVIYDATGKVVANGAYAIGQVYYVRVNGESIGVMIVK